jgi:hypothetical protein
MPSLVYIVTCEQFKHEYSERPVVGADVVALVQDDFGRHVLGRAAERPRLATDLQLFGETKVDELDVAGAVEKQVLGLEVAVDDASRVQVVERLHHASGVEACRAVVKVSAVPEKTELSF